MRLLVVDKETDEWGSTRIYRDNLTNYLRIQGLEVDRFDQNELIADPDSILFGKNSSVEEISEFKASYPDALLGLVHPTDNNRDGRDKIRLVDYFVVGSLEEGDGLLGYEKQILQFPQLEQVPISPKEHHAKSPLLIGYHGNRMHIENAGVELWRALDRISDEFDVKLRLIYNIRSVGRAKTVTRMSVEHLQWNLTSVWRDLRECDIGLVPGVIMLGSGTRVYNTYVKRSYGFKRDYMMRFKANSNAGRSFVFFQLGVPVVAGMVPSNLHILGNPDCGYIAASESGWYHAIRALAQSPSHRQEIADCAKRAFNREYDPNLWASRFAKRLTSICKKPSKTF